MKLGLSELNRLLYLISLPLVNLMEGLIHLNINNLKNNKIIINIILCKIQ